MGHFIRIILVAQLNIANVISRQSTSGRSSIDRNNKAGALIAQHPSRLARRTSLQQLTKQGGAHSALGALLAKVAPCVAPWRVRWS